MTFQRVSTRWYPLLAIRRISFSNSLMIRTPADWLRQHPSCNLRLNQNSYFSTAHAFLQVISKPFSPIDYANRRFFHKCY